MSESIPIAQANAVLEQRLQSLKTETDPVALGGIAEELNGLLYSAIVQYPAAVNAVRVSTIIHPNRSEEGLPDSRTIFSGRYKLKYFLKAALGIETLPETVEFEFVKHLPYSFTTGTHGSGERNAMGASCPILSIQTGCMKTDVPVFLGVDVADANSIMQEEIHLFPDEVQAMTLTKVSEKEFTPIARMHDRKYELSPSRSSAMHYVLYRGFQSYGVNGADIPNKNWKEGVIAIVGRVLVPNRSTGLFSDKWRFLSPVSVSGFAVDASGAESVLYEFTDVSIPRSLRESRFGEDAIISAYAMVQHTKRPQRNIQTYTGDGIIERLSQVEVERKF
ncbi:MAG TPA: hypothetical protein VJK52_04465 [Candidatus Nanoarchaeia archaeon]|nr:hypothetical protein [Candidatus Nanoarchaeia archaeon]